MALHLAWLAAGAALSTAAYGSSSEARCSWRAARDGIVIIIRSQQRVQHVVIPRIALLHPRLRAGLLRPGLCRRGSHRWLRAAALRHGAVEAAGAVQPAGGCGMTVLGCVV
jgi:hypothetical protein